MAIAEGSVAIDPISWCPEILIKILVQVLTSLSSYQEELLLPSRNTTTQQPGSKAEASSPKFASTKSGNLIVLYCKRCWKSIADAYRICFEMYGSRSGNPSDDNLNVHGEPSFDDCLS